MTEVAYISPRVSSGAGEVDLIIRAHITFLDFFKTKWCTKGAQSKNYKYIPMLAHTQRRVIPKLYYHYYYFSTFPPNLYAIVNILPFQHCRSDSKLVCAM